MNVKTSSAKKGGDSVNQGMHLLVFPAKDMNKGAGTLA